MSITRLIIPGVSGQDFKFLPFWVDKYVEALYTLVFLIAWRIQVTMVLSGTLTSKEIQALESMKFNAKAIATCGKPIAAVIAVKRTMWFDQPSISNLTPEEAQQYYAKQVKDLVENKPPRGVRILQPGQINPDTIVGHRYGIMASLTGQWQSKPLYEPSSVLTGIPPHSFELTDVLAIAISLHEGLFGPDVGEDKAIELGYFKEELENTIKLPPSFNDGVYISESNKTPVEKGFNFTRTQPVPIAVQPVPDEKDNPYLREAIIQSNNIAKATAGLKKSQPQAKSKSQNNPNTMITYVVEGGKLTQDGKIVQSGKKTKKERT